MLKGKIKMSPFFYGLAIKIQLRNDITHQSMFGVSMVGREVVRSWNSNFSGWKIFSHSLLICSSLSSSSVWKRKIFFNACSNSIGPKQLFQYLWLVQNVWDMVQRTKNRYWKVIFGLVRTFLNNLDQANQNKFCSLSSLFIACLKNSENSKFGTENLCNYIEQLKYLSKKT